MAEETDGVREAFDDALRIALTVATQLGEKVARVREQFARQREAGTLQTNRELEARFEAERAAMRASLLPLKQDSWWERASVIDIANVRETTVSWREYDEVARDTNDIIESEVQARYGIDADRPGADPAEVAESLRTAAWERANAQAKAERTTEELTAAQLLVAAANARDRDAVANSGTDELDYDSDARRAGFAAALVGKVDPATIDARILADGENARHPREAVLSQGVRIPKPKRGVGAKVQQRERGGIPGR